MYIFFKQIFDIILRTHKLYQQLPHVKQKKSVPHPMKHCETAMKI